MTEPRLSLGINVDALRIRTAMVLNGNHRFEL
jgi:hypothetical protein